jgi:predicted ATPase
MGAMDSWWPAAAIADADQAISNAREMGQAVTLMHALGHAAFAHLQCGNYAIANLQSEEAIALADEKGALFWKAWAMMNQGFVSVLTGKPSDAVTTIISAITTWRSTEATAHMPLSLTYLTRAYAGLGQFDDAWRCIGEAMTEVETTRETFCAAEINRIAGEIALRSPEPDTAKAEAYFERALAVAREQRAKSWELRSAMSMARLWRDQGRRDEARDLLAPVYGWFTEGFDTLDLKNAKVLLDELAAR